MFKKQLRSKKAAVPITSGQRRRASDPSLATGHQRQPGNNASQVSAGAPDATSTDEIDVHYYHGLEANTRVRAAFDRHYD